jgi:hypothetical protein
MGFLPEHDLGLVVLTNMEPQPTGGAWMNLVLERLLRRRLGLDIGGGATAMAQGAQAVADLEAVGRDAVPLNRKDVELYLGYYENGWMLTLDGDHLLLRNASRVGTMLRMPDGTFFVSASTLQGLRVTLGREPDGTRHLDLKGFETVRRTTGL